MRGKAKFHKTEETEINVSPLIDMVFILLIFFIVATSFVNEVGITPKHKDSTESLSKEPPLSFELTGTGQVMKNGSPVDLREIAPIVRTASAQSRTAVLVRVSPGARAGLATQVMDQALLGGAKAVKLSPMSK
jgi:biopolymer transport protein ExbD